MHFLCDMLRYVGLIKFDVLKGRIQEIRFFCTYTKEKKALPWAHKARYLLGFA